MFYCKYITIGLYILLSIPIFYLVYNTSPLVIDEEFHLRQGKHYCNGSFDVWDPKITTLPGLYIVSAIFLYPINICSTFALRLTSLIASIVNVWLIHEIRKNVAQTRQVDTIKKALESVIISIFPPMYFFAHLYYTDVLSITTVLAMMLFNLRHKHYSAAFCGFLSVIVRQTNIVWMAMLLGTTFIDKLILQTLPFIKGHEKSSAATIYTFRDILQVLGFYFRRIYLVPKQIRLLFVYLIGYIIVLVMFISFIFLNGSIVVGDKRAHEAALHLPQIFYYSLFVIAFAPSVVITHLPNTFQFLVSKWYFTKFAIILAVGIVYLNTLVHPYLLADNRHYTFYVWNRFYGKYNLARYLITPVYIFGIALIYKAISNKSAGFKLMYGLCATVAIALQRMIEVRYFLIPFMVFRLNVAPIRLRWLLVELAFYLVINAAVFYVFVTKEIHWSDFDEVQRLIW